MRQFEQIGFIPGERELEEAQHQENIELLLKEGERLSEDDFTDIYGPSVVKRDKKAVEELEGKLRKEMRIDNLNSQEQAEVEAARKRSEALEVIVVQGGDNFRWLGGARLVRTTKYDDLKHGVDAVAEFPKKDKAGAKEKPQRIALAIDACANPHLPSVREKMVKHFSRLTEEAGVEVKYYQSPIDGSKGAIEMVVPVVIGVEGKSVDDLIELFSSLLKLGEAPQHDKTAAARYKEKLEEAKEHPVQMIFLKEIEKQLDCYLRLLKTSSDKKSNFYKKEIEALLEKIKEITDSKKDIDFEHLTEDKIFQAIKQCVSEIK